MPTCSACGAEAAPSDAFCQACGTALTAAAPTATMMPPVAPAPPGSSGRAMRRPTPPASRVHQDEAGMVGVVVPPAVQDSELEGQAVPNQFYVGQRLGYSSGGAESLDPLNSRFIRALVLHWAIVFTIFLVGSGVIVLLGRILGSVTLMGLLLVVWWLVMGVVAWWFPIWASISEWKFMVDGKACGLRNRVPTHHVGVRAAAVTGRTGEGSSSLVRQLAKPRIPLRSGRRLSGVRRLLPVRARPLRRLDDVVAPLSRTVGSGR